MSLLTDIIAYYKLDGDSTDEVASNDGTDTNITYSAANGKIVQGAGFNGITSKIDLGTGIYFGGTQNVSYSFWLYMTDDNPGGYEWYLRDYKDTVYVRSGNGTNGYYFGLTGTSSGGVAGSTTLIKGNWYHIVVTYDGINAKVYLNGSPDGSTPTTGNVTDSDAVHAFIGSYSTSAFTLGNIDEVGVWERALTSTEVSQLWNSGDGMAYPFPIAAYTPLSVVATIPSTTASFLQVATAAFTSLSVIITVPAKTATYVCEKVAAYTSLSLEVAIPAITATFERAVSAVFSAVSLVLSIPAMIATLERSIVCSVGEFTLTGVTAIITSARNMVCSVGSFILTGIAAALKRGCSITADVGTFVLTGIATTITSVRSMVATVGSFTLTGITSTLKLILKILPKPIMRIITTNLSTRITSHKPIIRTKKDNPTIR